MPSLTHAQVIAMMERVGEITLTTEANIINRSDDKTLNLLHARVQLENDGPCVYAWVAEPPEGEREVLYVGKAGQTLEKRCREHGYGFWNLKRGKAHASHLWPMMRAGTRIGIYALWPDPVPFAGFSIPSHSSVEDWLLRVTKPTPVRNRVTRDNAR